jgi:hypothetical protein
VLLLGECSSGCWLAGRLRCGTSARLGGVLQGQHTSVQQATQRTASEEAAAVHNLCRRLQLGG